MSNEEQESSNKSKEIEKSTNKKKLTKLILTSRKQTKSSMKGISSDNSQISIERQIRSEYNKHLYIIYNSYSISNRSESTYEEYLKCKELINCRRTQQNSREE